MQNENESARGAEEKKAIYVTVNDGYGVPVKHLNFDNEEVCKKKGIIHLVPMRISKKHENRLSFRNYRDRKTEIVYGIPMYIDPETKRWVYEKITLVDLETLDLSIPHDAKKWAVIKNSPFLEGSPNLRDRPKYKIEDKERESEIYLSKRAIKRKAETIAEGLYGAELNDMARNLGINPDHMSVVMLQAAVVKYAENNAERFMDVWDSPTRHELTVLKRAMAMGVVTQDPINGITYQSIPLGINEPAAVRYLKENISTLQGIEFITKSKEEETGVAMSGTKAPAINDEKDVEIAKLKAELAKQAELNAKLADKRIKESVENDVNLSKEIALLRDRARELNIKGFALMNKETLEARIAEAEG